MWKMIAVGWVMVAITAVIAVFFDPAAINAVIGIGLPTLAATIVFGWEEIFY